jgi:hypothetical protein
MAGESRELSIRRLTFSEKRLQATLSPSRQCRRVGCRASCCITRSPFLYRAPRGRVAVNSSFPTVCGRSPMRRTFSAWRSPSKINELRETCEMTGKYPRRSADDLHSFRPFWFTCYRWELWHGLSVGRLCESRRVRIWEKRRGVDDYYGEGPLTHLGGWLSAIVSISIPRDHISAFSPLDGTHGRPLGDAVEGFRN